MIKPIRISNLPHGATVRLNHTPVKRETLLGSDGKVDPLLGPVSSIEAVNHIDSLHGDKFQSLLHRLKAEGPKLDNSRVDIIAKETLGERWRGANMGDGHQESLNLSFLTPRQGIRIEGSPARITVITDVDDDGCDRSWNHFMSANLSDEFAVLSDSILESANIHPKEPLQHRGPKS